VDLRTKATQCEANAEPSTGLEHPPTVENGCRQEKDKEYDGGSHRWHVFPEVVSSSIRLELRHSGLKGCESRKYVQQLRRLCSCEGGCLDSILRCFRRRDPSSIETPGHSGYASSFKCLHGKPPGPPRCFVACLYACFRLERRSVLAMWSPNGASIIGMLRRRQG
jgi:hypothetical protein